MGSQPDLQALLSALPGVAKAYFQSPGVEKMVYPCIIYNRNSIDTKSADNNPYKMDIRYSVTVISSTPGDPISLAVAALPKCSFDRPYKSDNLYHDVFTLYF